MTELCKVLFAGLKAVGESIAEPLCYYENNIESSLALCTVIAARGVKQLIFSFSTMVYGNLLNQVLLLLVLDTMLPVMYT